MTDAAEKILIRGLSADDVAPYINHNAPFGPVATEQIGDQLLWQALFDRENQVYAHLTRRDPAFVVGRRGAGKTAFLDALSTEQTVLHIEINTSTAVAEVEDLLRALTELGVTLFADHVSDIWGAALWHGLLVALVQHPPEGVDTDDVRFEDIKVYLDDLTDDASRSVSSDAVMSLFCMELLGQVEKRKTVARHPTLFELHGVKLASVIESATALLDQSQVQPILLLDSIEDFQDVLDYHTRTIEGLFMQVGRSTQPTSPYRIRFSFPAELWHVLRSMSRNPLKDFGRFIILQWSAREIVKIAAHRFMLYLEHFHRPVLDRKRDLARLNTDSEKEALELLRMVLPPTVTGELGVVEDTIAYVLRHTQLLPRHLLRLLNAIWTRSAEADGNGVAATADAVVIGVQDVEEQIVTEICKAYELVHPTADEVCRAVIKNLPRRFSDSELHKAFNRAGKGAVKRAYRNLAERRLAERSHRVGMSNVAHPEMDYFDFKAMLLEIGCIGRKIGQTERYDVAEFEYTIPHRLAVGDDDIMCVHPLFSGVYQSMPDASDDGVRRLVYPYGTDPTMDHRLRDA